MIKTISSERVFRSWLHQSLQDLKRQKSRERTEKQLEKKKNKIKQRMRARQQVESQIAYKNWVNRKNHE